jgi:hypothetical membrane protein
MLKTAGLLFFLAGTCIIMGIITAEIFYPGYSISANMISNLGATRPPHSIIHEPAATIFDSTMIITGLMLLVGAFFLHKVYPKHLVGYTMGFMGMGTFGVGIFPAFHQYAHPITAFVAFFAGGLSALVSSRLISYPFSWVAVVLGTVSLFVLLLGVVFPQTIVPLLGIGGTERWVFYPIALWLTGFGGFLMSKDVGRKAKK